jgi:hypothetical protein
MKGKILMSEEEIIIIYTDRETGKYKSYECVKPTEALTMEKINGYIENWNNNKEQKTYAKVYKDPVLSDFVKDAHRSITFNTFIDDLKDCLESIQDASRDIRYECEELTDFIKEKCEDITND